MHRVYWPVIVPGGIGTVILLGAIFCIWRGVIYSRGVYSHPITRDGDPIQFWLVIAMVCSVAGVFYYFAYTMVATGGVLVQ